MAHEAPLSSTIAQSLLKLMPAESVMPSNHLLLCHPLLLPPSVFPSIRVFSRVCSLHQVAKVLELQLQHRPFSFSINLPLNNNVSCITKIMVSYLTNNNNLILSNVPSHLIDTFIIGLHIAFGLFYSRRIPCSP